MPVPEEMKTEEAVANVSKLMNIVSDVETLDLIVFLLKEANKSQGIVALRLKFIL